MDEDEELPAVELIPLPEPRPLSANERALLDFLLAGPLGCDELRRQAATAQAVYVCSCGCPSVGLSVDPASPAAAFSVKDGAVSITAMQRKTKGFTEVTLHVMNGRMLELEIWAGYGVRPRVDLAKLEYESP